MLDPDNPLRQIPPVDRILDHPHVRRWIELTSREFVLGRLAPFLAKLRSDLRDADPRHHEAGCRILDHLEESFSGLLEEAVKPPLSKVVNATGVIIHTNLGRAPLATAAIEAVRGVAEGYSNLELNLKTGDRGHRDAHLEAALCEILGCQAATAVNNNAAAIFMVLNELACGGEVLVSRGELMEIGGSFRIPEILEKSGARLREVGTTNRTKLADYRAGIGEATRLILKVHPSNYRVVGFTESTPIGELASLGRETGLPVVEDAGSGLLVDLSAHGLTGEPRIPDSLQSGADLVTFSADKLLGGPQAGIIAGRADLIARLRGNPLMRILRLDKLTLAALSATLQLYISGRAGNELPVLRMIAEEDGSLKRRAGSLRRRLARLADPHSGLGARFERVPCRSVVGGGSCPGMVLPSWAVAVLLQSASAAEVEAALRSHQPPILARIEGDRVLLDVRTLQPGDDAHILSCFADLAFLAVQK